MDGWLIRTPRVPPDSGLSAPAPTSRSTPAGQAPSSRSTPSQRTSQPPSSRDSTPCRQETTIEVVLPQLSHEKPKLQPLQLIPTHDSTAYIKDKMVLKSAGLAADGNPLPPNMGYLVGWTDLPAASMVIPAGDVLEYVSPYALEQFEYDAWKTRKREEEAQRKRRAEAAMAAGATTTQEVPVPTNHGRPPAKRRGRPRKSVEVPVDEGAIQEEVRKRAGSLAKEGQPSLSTPKKLMGLASREQLFDDTEMESETSYPIPSREESREESEPPRKKLRSSSPTKEGGFGGGFVSGLSPTPKARLPMRGTSHPSMKSEEPSPISTSFTPIIPPRAAQRRTPGAQTPSESRGASASSRSSANLEKTKTPHKSSRSSVNSRNGKGKASQDPKNPEEVQYDVKRLEGMKQMTIDGRRERFFLVRWEGSWAPDENPTWEPEENIPRKLVKRYLEKKNAAGVEREEPIWKPRRYSSVTEAFEDYGAEEGNEGHTEVSDSHDEDQESDAEEKFEVTEARSNSGTSGARFLGRALDFAFGRGLSAGRRPS